MVCLPDVSEEGGRDPGVHRGRELGVSLSNTHTHTHRTTPHVSRSNTIHAPLFKHTLEEREEGRRERERYRERGKKERGRLVLTSDWDFSSFCEERQTEKPCECVLMLHKPCSGREGLVREQVKAPVPPGVSLAL